MIQQILIVLFIWILHVQAVYPGTTKEWDFMIETGQDNADINGGLALFKGGTLPQFVTLAVAGVTGLWREPIVTALGWSFEGEEVACMGPGININMGDTFSTHMWIYVYDFTDRQTVWC
jgi:hypothetical protein